MATSAETLIPDQNKVLDDEWTIVMPCRNEQRRKFPKFKSAAQVVQTHWVPTDLETTPERELQLMKKMQTSMEKLEKLQLFSFFLDQIRSPDASDYFLKRTGSKHKLKMVIYGIGSIESFEPPRLQLSLATLLKRKFDWIGEMEVFDPVISLTETKVIKELQCCVLSVNEQGRRPAVNSEPDSFLHATL